MKNKPKVKIKANEIISKATGGRIPPVTTQKVTKANPNFGDVLMYHEKRGQ